MIARRFVLAASAQTLVVLVLCVLLAAALGASPVRASQLRVTIFDSVNCTGQPLQIVALSAQVCQRVNPFAATGSLYVSCDRSDGIIQQTAYTDNACTQGAASSETQSSSCGPMVTDGTRPLWQLLDCVPDGSSAFSDDGITMNVFADNLCQTSLDPIVWFDAARGASVGGLCSAPLFSAHFAVHCATTAAATADALHVLSGSCAAAPTLARTQTLTRMGPALTRMPSARRERGFALEAAEDGAATCVPLALASQTPRVFARVNCSSCALCPAPDHGSDHPAGDNAARTRLILGLAVGLGGGALLVTVLLFTFCRRAPTTSSTTSSSRCGGDCCCWARSTSEDRAVAASLYTHADNFGYQRAVPPTSSLPRDSFHVKRDMEMHMHSVSPSNAHTTGPVLIYR